MLAVRAIPLRDRRVLVHVLNDLPPADPGVVGAERNLTLLGSVRDDAHFGPAEIVIEQVLKPHAGNEEEIPRI